jgi:carbamoyl-phosphate synthase large subunit
VNVLLTCVGLRVDNVTAFRDALHARGEGGLVVGTDADPMAPAVHFCDRWEQVPPASDPSYVDHLVALVERHEIAVVVPCSEWDLEELADGRERLEAAGATVFISDPGPTRTCVDKYRMHEFLVARGIPSPRTVDPADGLPDDLRYPVLVKMRQGRGSEHIYRCETRAEVEFFLDYSPVSSMVQELCPGEEFSIDLLCDLDGRCLNAIPRLMQGKKGGEQIKGTTIDDAELTEVARVVAEALPLRGPGTVQCFRVAPGRHEVTDVNPRFGGLFPLPLAAGGNYPGLMLALAAGEVVEPHLGRFRAGVSMARFFHQITLEPGPDGLEPTLGELLLGPPARGSAATSAD